MSTNVTEITPKQLEQMSCVVESDFVERDKKLCNCEIPTVRRKWNAALGTGIEIRLCCLAKKVEELADLPEGTFFLALDFEPTWEWDCKRSMVQRRSLSDGTVEETSITLGPPPRWLQERMQNKGIPIHNLPDA